jgi:urease gamma subunit
MKMRELYHVNPLLSANLAFELTNREQQMLVHQMSYLARAFKERIKELDKEELAYISCIILDAYSKQRGANYFFESLLSVIERQLNVYK